MRVFASAVASPLSETSGPAEFTEVRRSLLAYGLPDFTSFNLANPADRSRVQHALQSAIALRPGFGEAVFQLAELEMQHGELADARARIDHYIATYTATPDLLLLGVQVSKSLHDRIGQQRYEQRLRVDFPNSPQTQALASSNQHAG